MTVFKVQVTEDDIARGIRNECDSCPVALAITRATCCIVDVVGPEIYFFPSGAIYKLSDDITNIIERYDASGEMEPFEFELELDESDLEPEKLDAIS